jgi:hypothetical protein
VREDGHTLQDSPPPQAETPACSASASASARTSEERHQAFRLFAATIVRASDQDARDQRRHFVAAEARRRLVVTAPRQARQNEKKFLAWFVPEKRIVLWEWSGWPETNNRRKKLVPPDRGSRPPGQQGEWFPLPTNWRWVFVLEET